MALGSASRPELAGSALEQINVELRERLWSSVLIMALVLTPMSVARAWTTGWMPVFDVHVAVLAILICAQLLRSRIAPAWRVVLAVVYLEFTGAASLYRMGFIGFGGLWMAVGAYLIGVLYGRRAGWWAIAGHLLAAFVAMLGYSSGLLKMPINVDSYMLLKWPWVLFGAMMAIFPWMLLNSIGVYKQSILKLAEESERQRVEIERMASRDPLTGLLQQRVVYDHLQLAISKAVRTGRKVAVLFIDLDEFKQVNDRFGHAAGDHLLRAVGKVLGALIREGDTVGRVGGDEFLLVLDDLAGPESAEQVARRIVQELRRPVAYKDALLQAGASIGIAVYPEHGRDATTLQQAADAAMYVVKNSGRNGVAFSGAGPLQDTSGAVAADSSGKLRMLRR